MSHNNNKNGAFKFGWGAITQASRRVCLASLCHLLYLPSLFSAFLKYFHRQFGIPVVVVHHLVFQYRLDLKCGKEEIQKKKKNTPRAFKNKSRRKGRVCSSTINRSHWADKDVIVVVCFQMTVCTSGIYAVAKSGQKPLKTKYAADERIHISNLHSLCGNRKGPLLSQLYFMRT